MRYAGSVQRLQNPPASISLNLNTLYLKKKKFLKCKNTVWTLLGYVTNYFLTVVVTVRLARS